MLYSLIYFLWRLDVPARWNVSIINQQDDLTDHEKLDLAFNVPVSCVYIYSCWNVLEVHRYSPVHVEQLLQLFCKLFLSRRHMASLRSKGRDRKNMAPLQALTRGLPQAKFLYKILNSLGFMDFDWIYKFSWIFGFLWI